MFTTLRLENVGPHVDLTVTLDPTGSTTIKGPSGSGKSTLIRAVAGLLWGDPVSTNDADPDATFTIEGRTAKGNTLTRTSRRFSFQKKGQLAGQYTFANYANVIGDYARRADVGRYILVPHSADDFYTRNRGRDFRDILTAALGADDVQGIVRTIMGAKPATDEAEATDGDNRPGDPTCLADALRAQTAANRLAAEATGAAKAAESALTRARAELARSVVPAGDVEAQAEQTVIAAGEWHVYDAAAEKYVTATHARDRAVAQAADWTARRDALGTRPEMPDTMVARVKVTNAERAVALARHDIQEAERLRARAEGAEAARVAAEAAQQAAPPHAEPAPPPVRAPALFATPSVDVPVKIKGYGDHVITFDAALAVRFDGRQIVGK
jgi:energy-coupling factor transporter ATP-binding protein EcfA2